MGCDGLIDGHDHENGAPHWLCVWAHLSCCHEKAPCWMSVQAHLGCDGLPETRHIDGHGRENASHWASVQAHREGCDGVIDGHDHENAPHSASVQHANSEGCDRLHDRHVDGPGRENASHWASVQAYSEGCDGLIGGHDHENAPHWASVPWVCLDYDVPICVHGHWDERVLITL